MRPIKLYLEKLKEVGYKPKAKNVEIPMVIEANELITYAFSLYHFDEILEKVFKTEVSDEEVSLFIKFLEKLLERWGMSDEYQVNPNIARIVYQTFIVFARLYCICMPRLCPCKEFLVEGKCKCGLFIKKKR